MNELTSSQLHVSHRTVTVSLLEIAVKDRIARQSDTIQITGFKPFETITKQKKTNKNNVKRQHYVEIH